MSLNLSTGYMYNIQEYIYFVYNESVWNLLQAHKFSWL